MKLLFELSGEHPLLPRAELYSILSASGISYREAYSEGCMLLLETDAKDASFAGRLAMTHKTVEVLSESEDLSEASKALSERIDTGRTVAVRSESNTLEKRLGGELTKLGYRIDLKNPDVTIAAIKAGERLYTGIDLSEKKGFSLRRPQMRPYFHPTSMDPKIARVLVNLSGVRPKERLLDPFCGTGGILVEAAMMGVSAYGSDIDERMVEGCQKNLRHFGLQGEIRQGDALKVDESFRGMDAIVSDPPYARASFVTERDLAAFYEKFVSAAYGALKPGGSLVMVVPDTYSFGFSPFDAPSAEYLLRVHKSLTRRIIVLKKP